MSEKHFTSAMVATPPYAQGSRIFGSRLFSVVTFVSQGQHQRPKYRVLPFHRPRQFVAVTVKGICIHIFGRGTQTSGTLLMWGRVVTDSSDGPPRYCANGEGSRTSIKLTKILTGRIFHPELVFCALGSMGWKTGL